MTSQYNSRSRRSVSTIDKVKTGLLYGGAGLGLATTGLLLYLRTKTDNLPRDLGYIWMLLQVKRHLNSLENKNWTIATVFTETAQKFPDKEAIRFIESSDSFRTYTYREVDLFSNRVANWALGQGIKKGDVVALMMDNRPEFLFFWIGLAKIGAVISLINTNLKGGPLKHSFNVCKASSFLIGAEHLEAVQEVRPSLEASNPKFFIQGGTANDFVPVDNAVLSYPATAPPPFIGSSNDNLAYIYTSGTTGNPKASIIKNLRFYTAGIGFSQALKFTEDDRIYCCLPLYHSAGLMIGVGSCWVKGLTLILRRKFSATSFFADCAKHNATIVQYIGELCRYLLATPPSSFDKAHKVRLAIGNGLRPDIWTKFQERFNIPQIGEFYAATEGNAALMNTENKPHAIGFINPLLQTIFPLQLVRFDLETEMPIRGKDGFCTVCKPGEVGELLGLIEQTDPTRQFHGYTDAHATEKKILKDVFKKGDMYFRTGDLLKMDEQGFMYFVDRIGDTFRWKGENVSTNEVAEVISQVPGVIEANVYGVHIPNHDGRAGMACIVVDKNFNMNALYEKTKKELPSYASPVFLRLRTEMDTTGTFKYKKSDLVQDGFNPSKISDPLYFRDVSQNKYVPIDNELYQKISSNNLNSKL